MFRSLLQPTLRNLTRPVLLRRSPYSQLPANCPSCSQPLPVPLPACTKCEYISPLPSHITYHDIFGLPYEPNPFVIDAQELKGRFRKAQAVCHPDAWTSKGPQKLHLAQALSSQINRGYQALSFPFPRVEYILKNNGMEISESDNMDDQNLIMEIMEIREELDDADLHRVLEIEKENKDAILRTVRQIEELVGRKDWESVKRVAIRLKYLQGIEMAIKNRSQNLT